jgi:hypothetical protein
MPESRSHAEAVAAVVGIGVIDWALRDATGEVLRAPLRGNLVVQVLSVLVTTGEILAGHLPAAALSASAIHAVLCVVFFLALQTASATD